MTTFTNISYDEFRKSAAEFFKATLDRSSLTEEEADNGNKALGLLYFGHSNDWTEQEINSSVIILELAMKRCMEVSFARIMAEQETELHS